MKKPLPHEEVKIQQFAIEALVKGYSNSELLTLLIKDYPHLALESIEKIIRSSHNRIKEATLLDLDKIIPVHIELYEKIYKEMDELYSMQGKLRAMRQKEKLVGLLRETNVVEIYNEVNVEIESEMEYDLSKLTNEEKKKLENLWKKVVNK